MTGKVSEGLEQTNLYARAERAATAIRARSDAKSRIALVLGSGLGGFADEFEDSVAIPYKEIPGFASSTAQGHAGRLVIGKVEQKQCRDEFISMKAIRSSK